MVESAMILFFKKNQILPESNITFKKGSISLQGVTMKLGRWHRKVNNWIQNIYVVVVVIFWILLHLLLYTYNWYIQDEKLKVLLLYRMIFKTDTMYSKIIICRSKQIYDLLSTNLYSLYSWRKNVYAWTRNSPLGSFYV